MKDFLKASNLNASADVCDYFKQLENVRLRMIKFPETPLPSQESVQTQPKSGLKYSEGVVELLEQPKNDICFDFDPAFKYDWEFGKSKVLNCFVYSVLPNDRNEWTKLVCPKCFSYGSETCECRIQRVQTPLVAIHLVSHLGSSWTLKAMISGEDGIRIFTKLSPEILQSYKKDGKRHRFVITKYYSNPGSPEPHVFLCQDIDS
jgi:hypothetical protein